MKNQTQIIDIIKFVHINLYGPFLVRSLGGSFYFITFIVEYFHKLWVYFLIEKNERFNKYFLLNSQIKNFINKIIKTLQLD